MVTKGFLMFWGGIAGTILVIIAAIIFLLRSINVKRQVQNAFDNGQQMPGNTLEKAEWPLDETVRINNSVKTDGTVLIGHEKVIDETVPIDEQLTLDETVLLDREKEIDKTVLLNNEHTTDSTELLT